MNLYSSTIWPNHVSWNETIPKLRNTFFCLSGVFQAKLRLQMLLYTAFAQHQRSIQIVKNMILIGVFNENAYPLLRKSAWTFLKFLQKLSLQRHNCLAKHVNWKRFHLKMVRVFPYRVVRPCWIYFNHQRYLRGIDIFCKALNAVSVIERHS